VRRDPIRVIFDRAGGFGLPIDVRLAQKRPQTYLYRARSLVERFFNKIRHCRRGATRYDKLAANSFAVSSLLLSGYGCALDHDPFGLNRIMV